MLLCRPDDHLPPHLGLFHYQERVSQHILLFFAGVDSNASPTSPQMNSDERHAGSGGGGGGSFNTPARDSAHTNPLSAGRQRCALTPSSLLSIPPFTPPLPRFLRLHPPS